MNRFTAMCATHSDGEIEKMKVSNFDDSNECSSEQTASSIH